VSSQSSSTVASKHTCRNSRTNSSCGSSTSGALQRCASVSGVTGLPRETRVQNSVVTGAHDMPRRKSQHRHPGVVHRGSEITRIYIGLVQPTDAHIGYWCSQPMRSPTAAITHLPAHSDGCMLANSSRASTMTSSWSPIRAKRASPSVCKVKATWYQP
jgi:hypothetical protein